MSGLSVCLRQELASSLSLPSVLGRIHCIQLQSPAHHRGGCNLSDVHWSTDIAQPMRPNFFGARATLDGNTTRCWGLRSGSCFTGPSLELKMVGCFSCSDDPITDLSWQTHSTKLPNVEVYQAVGWSVPLTIPLRNALTSCWTSHKGVKGNFGDDCCRIQQQSRHHGVADCKDSTTRGLWHAHGHLIHKAIDPSWGVKNRILTRARFLKRSSASDT